MAKKVTSNSKNEFTFSEIGKLVQDISKNVPIIIARDEQETELISTGIYILNAALSGSLFGGIQSNRITTFAGPSGTGKSFLAYNIVKNAQKSGYSVIYIDTEFSIQRSQLPNYGIDTSDEKFSLIRTNVVEDIIKLLTQIITKLKEVKASGTEIQKLLLVVDSVGMMASRKEIEDANANKETADMTKAKKLTSLFRIINNDLGYLNIPMICTNHTYEEIGMFPKTIMKGGMGLYYSSSVVSFLSKAKLKDGNEDEMDLGQSGIVVTLKSEKNRMAKPKKVKFEISFVKGCNPYIGLEAFCRPEYFESIGIAKGKWEEFKKPEEVTNEDTGEVKVVTGKFVPGGIRYYVRHLNKSFHESQLHTGEIFNQDVLNNLEPFIQQYFKYRSLDELEETQAQYDTIVEDVDDSVENISTSDLFD